MLTSFTRLMETTLNNSFAMIIPEIILLAFACVLILVSCFGVQKKTLVDVLTILGLLFALLVSLPMIPTRLVYTESNIPKTFSILQFDFLGFFLAPTIYLLGLLLWLFIYYEKTAHAAEYQSGFLVMIAGVSLVSRANDLVLLWLALEMLSIPTYIMLYLPSRHRKTGQEATIKYFVLSILSSAFLLFGFSYLYGMTGATNLQSITYLMESYGSGDYANLMLISLVMIVAGLGFRITAFPFHFYAPDVYQTAPISMVAILSTLPKIAGFVALIRILGLIHLSPDMSPALIHSLLIFLWVLCAITMTVGNMLALRQENLRRLIAYSGVAHSGYMLLGICTQPLAHGVNIPISLDLADNQFLFFPTPSILFYMIAYSGMTLGFLAVLLSLKGDEQIPERIDDLSGLHETHPYLAFAMLIFLLSLIGLPLTSGFMGKFMLIYDLLSAPNDHQMSGWYQTLAVVTVLNAAVAAYYYLKIIGVMYLRNSFQKGLKTGFTFASCAILFCTIITLGLGIYPSPVISLTKEAMVTPVNSSRDFISSIKEIPILDKNIFIPVPNNPPPNMLPKKK